MKAFISNNSLRYAMSFQCFNFVSFSLLDGSHRNICLHLSTLYSCITSVYLQTWTYSSMNMWSGKPMQATSPLSTTMPGSDTACPPTLPLPALSEPVLVSQHTTYWASAGKSQPALRVTWLLQAILWFTF